MGITCFDIADISIAAALEAHPEKKLNTDVIADIRENCAILDGVAAENECSDIHTDVNVDCNELLISLVCPAFDFTGGRSNSFFKAIERSRYFSFRNNGDGNVCLLIAYDGVFQ